MSQSVAAAGHLTWDEVARRMQAGAVAILALGSGAKQHGLHLPLNTDQLIAGHFAHELAGHLGHAHHALIWPALSYGYYPAFAAYAGSVSLTETLFVSLIKEIVMGLLGQGARHVVIVDAGLSTRAAIEHLIQAGKLADTVSRFGIFEGAHFVATAGRLRRQAHGSHADEIETSLMLALFPDVVDMARAAASPPLPGGPQSGPLEPFHSTSANYAPSGSFGDPTLATRDAGDALASAIGSDVADFAARLGVRRRA